MQTSLYRQICAAQGVTFVAVPERFIAAPGVLAPEAWGADASHANPFFGEAMVIEAFRSMEAGKASEVS
jgi:hypothetical protein